MLKDFSISVMILFLLLSAGNLYAEENENIFFPDFSLNSSENEPVFTARLPWHQPDDLTYNRERSVFWNQNYRAEIGQFNYTLIEYQKYTYNNRTDRLDAGTIKQYHSSLEFRSGIFPSVVMIFGIGYSQLERDPSTDATTHYQKFQGFNVLLGFETGISIIKEFLLIFHGDWRIWSGWSGAKTTGDEVYGHRWNAEMRFLFEIIGEYDGPTLDIVAGIGYHYVVERWTVDGTTYNISPNNSVSLANGPESFDIITAVWFSPRRWISMGLEMKFIGITQGRLIVSFIFG